MIKSKFSPYVILLFASTLLIFAIFGSNIFHLNELFINFYGDGIKNYYTFIYHALYGKGIHFEGMNYPYGEHITYTDGQPFILLLNQLFGFINDISSGILTINLLVIANLILTPFVLFKMLKEYNLPHWFSITCALFIAFNAPQINRILSHYALSYSLIVVLVCYSYLKYTKDKRSWRIIVIIITSTIGGLIHPYYSLMFFILGGSVLAFELIKVIAKKSELNLYYITALFISFIIPFVFHMVL